MNVSEIYALYQAIARERIEIEKELIEDQLIELNANPEISLEVSLYTFADLEKRSLHNAIQLFKLTLHEKIFSICS